MSATIAEGNFEISKTPLWDAEEELWYVKAGVLSPKGKLKLHITSWGKSPEVATNRAVAYCQIMTAMRPPNSEII